MSTPRLKTEKLATEPTESTEAFQHLNRITESVIGCAIEVHRHLGPGLLESTYETCLTHELEIAKHQVQRQVSLPIRYKGLELPGAYRIDLLIDQQVICELKATDKLESLHEAQLLSYLKLSGLRVGLLLNFNVKLLRNGIRRVIL